MPLHAFLLGFLNNFRKVAQNMKSIGEYGQVIDCAEAARLGEEILRLVRCWRERLGTKRYLLDDYLRGILKALTETTSAYDTADEGFNEALSDLRGICRAIREGREDEAREHPFYPTLAAYLAAHDIPKDSLHNESCCAGLFAEFSEFAAHRFIDECDTRFREALEREEYEKRREALLNAEAGISMQDVDRLYYLIMRLFIRLSPASVFIQGMIDQVTMSLILRDIKSGDYVFQRLLDGKV